MPLRRNKSDGRGRVGGKGLLVACTAALLLLVGGLWSARESGIRIDERMRRDLLRQAVSVAETLPIGEAAALSFAPEDAGRPEFQRVAAQLRAYARAAGLRSLYTMFLREGRHLFGPESLEDDDPYASSPGTAYLAPGFEDFEVFRTGDAMVQGPRTDEYGTFVSALAPAVHPRTGEVLLVVGLDAEAADWRIRIRQIQMVPLLCTMVPLAVLGLAWWLARRRGRRTAGRAGPHFLIEAAACATILLLLTAAAAAAVQLSEKRAREQDFLALSRFEAEIFLNTVKGLEQDLGMLARFFEASDSIDAQEFRTYTGSLLERTGLHACFWGLRAAESEPPVFPIRYLEPAQSPGLAACTDLHADPAVGVAVDEALGTGLIAASDPVDLGGEPGLLLVKAVMSGNQKGLVGFAVPAGALVERLGGSAKGGGVADLSISLFLLPPDGAPSRLAGTGRDGPGDEPGWFALRRGLRETVPVFAFGRAYALLATPSSRWLAARTLHGGTIVLFSGLFLAALASALVSVLASRPARLEALVRRRTAELAESEERFSIAAAAARIGIWDRDLADNRLVWDAQMLRIYGMEPGGFDGTFDGWKRCVHPDDLPRAMREIGRTADGDGGLDMQFRIVRPDGGIRHVHAFGKVLRTDDGAPLRMVGLNLDITERKLDEQRLAEQFAELQRWHKAMIDREERVSELKSEVEALRKACGLPPRYARNETQSHGN